MKLAHRSDLHLGYGGTGRGRGRASDVLRVFETALERIADFEPELVVIAGDVFDNPDVPPPPIAVFSRAAAKLRERVPGVVLAVVAGARDTPLDPERHGPLAVVGALESVEAATAAARRLTLREGKVGVTLVPHPALAAARPRPLRPDPGARRNVLVMHAAVTPRDASAPRVRLADWDYIALGSNHTRTELADRAHYCGSLERIGPDPWSEAAVDKGFLTADLETGEVAFRPVEARAAVSLAPIDAAGGSTATVARRLNEALAGVPGGIDGKLLRVPVRGLSVDDFAVLDREVLGRIRSRVVELRVDALPASSPRTKPREHREP